MYKYEQTLDPKRFFKMKLCMEFSVHLWQNIRQLSKQYLDSIIYNFIDYVSKLD